jgi:zinc transport system substrate-binding protein
VVKLQSADLILLNGADFSKWTNTTTLPMAKVVNTSRHFADRFIMMEGAVVHRHGPEGEHSHVGLASFTWLDPEQALEQALEIALALKKHRPSAAGEIDERWKSLEKDLHALRDRLTSMAAVRKEPLLASHPLYEYLGRFLGWDLTSYHWEPKEMPSDEEWKGLESHLAKKPTRWMIWEAPPADEIAQRLVALGVQPVVFDCATHRPATGDYMTVMNQNAENLRRVYEYEPDGDATPSEKAEGDAAEGSE